VPGTVSWVIPTVMALIALERGRPLKLVTEEDLERRVHLRYAMLFDRMCPGGGWNAGNSIVYDVALAPHIDASAIALAALRNHWRSTEVMQSQSWLVSAVCSSAYSLAWKILALRSYLDVWPDVRATARSTRATRGARGRSGATRRDHNASAFDSGPQERYETHSPWSRHDEAFHSASFWSQFLASTGALAVQRMRTSGLLHDLRKPQSRVAILHADSYAARLEMILTDGLRLFVFGLARQNCAAEAEPDRVHSGCRSEYNPLLVGAAANAFFKIGAKDVLVAEGPGHQRDTYLVVAESGLEKELRERRIRFVDLNRDEIVRVPIKTGFTGLASLWLPRTVLNADFVVSMPKVKTHHWAGIMLGLKNMFGMMPGVVYGWPKNVLHWKGIDRSILDIKRCPSYEFRDCRWDHRHGRQRPPSRISRNLECIVLSDDPVAADFTCARLMGLNPWRVSYLAQAAEFLGNGVTERIQ
jgi:uncharacterized protein (DUF362 family)